MTGRGANMTRRQEGTCGIERKEGDRKQRGERVERQKYRERNAKREKLREK